MPGAVTKPRRQPPWYSVRILEEERPDLADANGKINLEDSVCVIVRQWKNPCKLRNEAALMDMFIRKKSDLQTGDLIVTDDNNETVEKNTLFAMKTSIRPYSVNITLRMKRELRILNELKKNKCPYSPVVLDSGRVADLPFIGKLS
ncbi:unnamed protein product [Strongylus vulgaris]|uniref:Uncharacterized protein n=1 Tax=Strongylus vulgaris TaxID=40348 RepID=A0A3P7JE40_STRVU|nr:unnamed protein product [Strongylus vulgaris]